jgi:hypothetical protein
MARDEIDAKKIEKDNTYIRDYYYAEFAELFFSNEKNDISTSTANLKMIASSTSLLSASAYYNGTVFLVYT